MTQEVLQEAASTRERVRGAALELFGEKGYDGASMNEIAERVGIAKPSLYNYYRSKEELLIDLVEQGMAMWTEACMAPFERPASFERQLADHLRLTVEFAREQPHVVAVFHLATTHVQGELATRIQAMVEEMESSIHGRFDQRIRRAIGDGELDVESAEDVHVFLGVFFHGVLFLQTNCPHQVGPMNERLEQVWRLLFRGISGREPKESLNA